MADLSEPLYDVDALGALKRQLGPGVRRMCEGRAV
jgi:hypothetical protein